MNLDVIRKTVRENLDDKAEVGWSEARLDQVINDAYHDVQSLAEVADETILSKGTLVSLLPATTSIPNTIVVDDLGVEYLLPSDFRKILAIHLQGAPSFHWIQGQIVDIDRASFYRGLDDGKVFYVRHEDVTPGASSVEGGRNYIGVVAEGSSFPSDFLYITYTTVQDEFEVGGDGNQFPVLPTEWHHLITLGATVRALLQENSDASGFTALYDDAVAVMLQSLPRRDGAFVEAVA